MALRLGSTVVDCADVDRMTRFWCGLLELRPAGDDDDFRRLDGDGGSLSLQRTPDPSWERGHVHLDLYSDDLDADVARAVGLGATVVRRVDRPAETWVVLSDPEGNPFCLCRR